MDIEDLNNTQLLLLTLLVNFVTSIATGVIIVSLLDDTSPTVTQTVNRIVERTVESVAEAPEVIPSIIPPKETPAAPTEEERRTAAINAVSARSVAIYKNMSAKAYVTQGTYLPKSKAVVTVASAASLPSEVAIQFPDGTMVEASKSKSSNGLTIYGFADDAVLPAAPGSNLVATAEIKPGQTAIGIAADKSAVTGMVTKVDAAGVTTTVTGVPAGASIVNLSGSVIGISQGTGVYLPAALVNDLLSTPGS